MAIFSTYPVKTPPDPTDQVMIADSADGGSQKLVSVVDINSNTTSNTFTVDNDSVLGKIIIDVALGAADKNLTLTNEVLTGNQIATFQNASGTVSYISDIGVDANLSAAAQGSISASHTQNTDTGTTGNSFTIDSDSALGKIIVDVATGVADKSLTLTNEALTGDHIIAFPNATGTVALISNLPYLEEDIIPIEFCADGAVAPDAAEDYVNTNAKCRIRKFSGAADQDVIFQWPVPKYIDPAVKPQFLVEYIVSEAVGPIAQIVAFSLAGYSIGTGDNTTAAFGAAVEATSGSVTQLQHVRGTTAQSGDITVTDLAAGELAFFNLIRLATTTDTYAEKVAVTNIKIFWKRL